MTPQMEAACLNWCCKNFFFVLQVDKHIRRLDTDLARFEADLKEKQIESTDYDSTSSKGKKGVCFYFSFFFTTEL